MFKPGLYKKDMFEARIAVYTNNNFSFSLAFGGIMSIYIILDQKLSIRNVKVQLSMFVEVIL